MKPGDILYFLGDLSMGKQGADYFFSKLPRHITFHWVRGNHDKNIAKYAHKCASITELKEIKIRDTKVVLCHYPMLTWNCSHYNSWMLYGHHHIGSHGTDELDTRAVGKMLNVNCEMNDFKPWSELDVIKYMENRPDNWDLVTKGT
jgi:calcineurin-like phosphoesterase family protein